MKSTQIELIPLSFSHCEELLCYAQDPTLWTWWARQPPTNLSQMQQEVQTALDQQEQCTRLAYAIKHIERQELIGSTSFLNINNTHKTIEIGSTWLGTPFQNSGINQDCKNLLINYAFNGLNMNRIALQTDELNTRSRRAIEKLGAQFEGILRYDRIIWDGRIRSSAMYSILKDEWN